MSALYKQFWSTLFVVHFFTQSTLLPTPLQNQPSNATPTSICYTTVLTKRLYIHPYAWFQWLSVHLGTGRQQAQSGVGTNGATWMRWWSNLLLDPNSLKKQMYSLPKNTNKGAYQKKWWFRYESDNVRKSKKYECKKKSIPGRSMRALPSPRVAATSFSPLPARWSAPLPHLILWQIHHSQTYN
jgi:hypothetical protein